ncbi:MAG TPA: four helix bundle protein [Patescibacteria group bacterium]|nr:four helix bundle protein [Patescibacteria group bacterium]
MKTFRFLDFPVYKESKLFHQYCIKITTALPRTYWELGDQLRRAALSICLNISEGSAKYSDRDFKRFIENALGSANESFACLDIAINQKLITQKTFLEGQTLIESITRQLGGLSKKLRAFC